MNGDASNGGSRTAAGPYPRLRHALRPLVVACILLPACVFGALAYLDYRLEAARGRQYVQDTAETLAEHAQTVLQTTDLVLARVLDRIAGKDWDTLRHSRELYAFLTRLKLKLPQVESVFLVDPTGMNVASSRLYPFQPIAVSEREYFIAARQDGALHVSAPFRGIIAGTLAFTVSRARITNGKFDGVVAVTVSPAYFDAFYRAALQTPFDPAASLVRSDGALLVRFPEVPSRSSALDPDSQLLAAVRTGATHGVYRGASALDGHWRLMAFQRLDGTPLVVNFAIDEHRYLATWRTHAAVLGCLALLLSAGLLMIERLASTRTARETEALRALVAETERRQDAEAAMTQMQKMEALGRLTGGVAHDFNNLLAAILGSLELAAKRVKDERLLRLLTTASDAAQRGARLTAQMLAFSRKHEIATEPVDPNALIGGMDEMLRRSLGPMIRVRYELAAACWPVLADPVQLEVALLNLAVNARDAMPLGGDLILRTSMVHNQTAADAPVADAVCIAVIDSGSGMTPEVRAHAFEPFFTTKGPSKGTGLGLSMVYGYVTQIGGTVALDSSPGAGTTVSLFLPRAAALPQAQHAAPVRQTVSRGLAGRVLLVDDDASVRTSVNAMLEDLGCVVTIAESTSHALEILHADRGFDLLLLDFAMPGMTGAQLASEIARFWPEPPILFMTGYVEIELLQPWLDRGFRTLRKPFTSAELAAAVDEASNRPPAADNVVALRK